MTTETAPITRIIVEDYVKKLKKSGKIQRSIQPVVGPMRLSEVKPMRCKIILNRMDANYAGSTIDQTYVVIGTMFKSAVVN